MNTENAVAFLLGVPRSGTTLLSLLLNQHPCIHCPSEPWLLLGLDALGQVPCEHAADPPLVAGAIGEFLGTGRIAALKEGAEAIYRQALQRSGKSLFVDKTPRYYHVLDLVECFLSESKIILMLRNPLDVAASFKTSWGVNLPDLIAARDDSPFLFDYVLGFNQLLDFADKHPVVKIHYEDLVTDLDSQVQRLFEYFGLESHPVSPDISARTAGYADSSFGDKGIRSTPRIHPQSVNAYQAVFSPRELAVLIGALGRDVFSRAGYRDHYAEVCDELQISPPAETSADLLRLAQEYVGRRRARCAAPSSQGRLDAENDVLNQQLEWVKGELYETQKHHAKLGQELEAANADKVNLGQQLDQLRDMGFRDRFRADLRYARKRVKRVADGVIWRIANGPATLPLPKITLVTPVLNGELYIEAALRSVLSQDYPFLEYIVVDGGSTDNTLQIIERIRNDTTLPNTITELSSEPDEGMYHAIAKGFSRATGDVLGYLNADDLLEAGALASVGGYFAGHPEVQVIYHEDAVLVDGWKFPNIRQPGRISTADLLDKHILFQDGVFFRRGAYQAVGGLRRDLKLAGDYDLWLRLSARCRFVRRPGHVSCFRIRPGQLSTDMPGYHREVDRVRHDFLATRTPLQKIALMLKSAPRPLCKLIEKARINKDRLFFPIDFGNLPPPEVVLCGAEYGNARSPIDGKPAERLLFSAPDTRFGDNEINHIYLDARHGIAITYPPIESGKLNALYRNHYSSPPAEIKPANGHSPYRLYDGKRLWEKALLRLPVQHLTRLFRNGWTDNTLTELRLVLRSSGVNVNEPLRFLDAGSFEGHLLDQIADQTAWRAQGLEPNSHAVRIARGKGHDVHQGHVEDAVDLFADEKSFDVIFMGQSIEHVEDPLLVLRKLRLLLGPGGVLVVSTPNLDSREIDWFGPTWAHWHPPYHRYIFSRKGLHSLAEHAGLRPVHFRSFSHCYWTAMSITQNFLGLGGSVSHSVNFDHSTCVRAQRIHFWEQLLWNRLGKGDYCFLAMREGAR